MRLLLLLLLINNRSSQSVRDSETRHLISLRLEIMALVIGTGQCRRYLPCRFHSIHVLAILCICSSYFFLFYRVAVSDL